MLAAATLRRTATPPSMRGTSRIHRRVNRGCGATWTKSWRPNCRNRHEGLLSDSRADDVNRKRRGEWYFRSANSLSALRMPARQARSLDVQMPAHVEHVRHGRRLPVLSLSMAGHSMSEVRPLLAESLARRGPASRALIQGECQCRPMLAVHSCRALATHDTSFSVTFVSLCFIPRADLTN